MCRKIKIGVVEMIDKRYYQQTWKSSRGVSEGSYLIFVTNLEDIVARFYICDVNPLAVDVCVVGIITPWAQALHIGQHPYKELYKETSY